MNTKHGKATPVWVLLVQLPVAFLLITILPSCSSSLLPDNALVYLSIINGDVKVSDGISDFAAQNGAIIPGEGRTVLKTGKGNASLMMRDGSYVILDSNSMIEFNRKYMEDPGMPFAFNLVKGRALVINGQDSQKPTQVFVGSAITAQVFQAAMGLEVHAEDYAHDRVDCLIGPCVVNGDYYLVSGQSASNDPDGTVLVAAEIPHDVWISLGNLDATNPILSNLFASLQPTIIPTTITMFPTYQAATIIPNTPGDKFTPSPSNTVMILPMATPTLITTFTASPTWTPTLIRATYVPPTVSATPKPPKRSKPGPTSPPATEPPPPTQPPPPPTQKPPATEPPRPTQPPPPPTQPPESETGSP